MILTDYEMEERRDSGLLAPVSATSPGASLPLPKREVEPPPLLLGETGKIGRPLNPEVKRFIITPL